MIRNSIIASIICLLSPSCATMTKMAPFIPLRLERDQFVEEDMPQAFRNQITHVLRYYNESYKLDEQKGILVSKKLAEDEDLRWNYTNKAKDAEWIENHPLDL